jgi:hypothetical protein
LVYELNSGDYTQISKIDNENKYEFEIDSPLNGSYLLGFFAQRYELMKNNKVKNESKWRRRQ